MPAKPRRLLELRRDADERRALDEERREVVDLREVLRELDRGRDDRDLLEVLERERELDRARPALDRPDDFLRRCDLVSPFSARILLTVRAATSSARPP